MSINKYTENWNEALALWREPGPGHTPETYDLPWLHAGRVAAWRLVAAGVAGALDTMPVERVLMSLSVMQEREGAHPGGFRWYWEESRIHDTNATFFTTLALVLLELEFGATLAPGARQTLRAMLRLARGWFAAELEALEGALRYPNKTLGDLVCAWLLAEVDGDPAPALHAQMARAAAYYQGEEWGWGEHLSDVYATVCQYELMALLLYGRALPPPLRTAYEALFAELNEIDALYAGGPRVPAIRSYSFEASPGMEKGILQPRPTFIDSLALRPAQGKGGIFTPLRGLAKRHDLADRYRVRVARPPSFTVPCFGGAQAFATVNEQWRMGVMSRYPFMPGTEHPTWGLCWQSMPLCYWDAWGAWGFAQWEAAREGVVRAHPANSRHHRGVVQLSGADEPPLVGATYGAMRDGQCLALRVMGQAGGAFARVVDRFRLLGSHFDGIEETRRGDWYALTSHATGTGHSLRILCHPLAGAAVPTLCRRTATAIDWEVAPSDPGAQLATLWVWQAGAALAAPPAPQSVRAMLEREIQPR